MENYPVSISIEREYPFIIIIGEPSGYVINTVPDWLLNLKDKYLLLGDNLVYELGDQSSFSGTEVIVKLDLRLPHVFADYDVDNNTFIVNGDLTMEDDVGLWKIFVEVTYVD